MKMRFADDYGISKQTGYLEISIFQFLKMLFRYATPCYSP